jgi:hypothetical protein
LFGLTGRRLPALHWSLWLLLGMGPIGLDGFSQIFSQFNLDWLTTFLPYRESTPFLRVLTGGLFGLTTAGLYTHIEESMNDMPVLPQENGGRDQAVEPCPSPRRTESTTKFDIFPTVGAQISAAVSARLLNPNGRHGGR